MRLTTLAITAALAGAAAYGQNLITAKPGVIHLAEGDVLVSGKPVENKVGIFTNMKSGDVLTTADGRAEVLLSPGVFLRVTDHTMVKMVNNDLSDTRLELMEGSMNIEASEAIKENRTTVIVKGAQVVIKKDGIFSFDTAPEAQVRVWNGEAIVDENGKQTTLKSGRFVALNGDGKVEKFDTDNTDELYRWAKRRSGYNAMANVSGARSGNAWLSSGAGFGNWYFNPYYNMFTYIPIRGIWNSPFGYHFYSPAAVWSAYYPGYYGGGGGYGGGGYSPARPTWNSDLGYSTMPSRSSESYGGRGSMGGGGMSAPSGGAGGGAVSAPPSRGGGGSVGRAGGGRGN